MPRPCFLFLCTVSLHVANADILGREFFFRVNVINATEIPDVDSGYRNEDDQCYLSGSDVIVRTEIGGRGKLAELKPGFVSSVILGDPPTLNDPWTSNIVNAELGQELRISLLDYNDPDGRLGDNACTDCHSAEIDCADEASRQEICKVMFGSTCIDDGGVDGCPGSIGGVSAQECHDSQKGCEDVKTEKGTDLCGDANRQPIGFVALGFPVDVETPSGVSWDPDLLGNLNRAGGVRQSTLTVVKRSNSSTAALEPLPQTSSVVSFTVQFWASKCAVGEFITAQGFCQACSQGFECPTGVTPAACPPGKFNPNVGLANDCFPCPVDSYSENSASTACKPCEVGSFSWPEGSTSCTLEVGCSNFEDEISPRVNGTQPVCVQKTGVAYTAAKAGMSVGVFIFFIIMMIVLAGLLVAAFLYWAHRKQQLAKQREAKLAQDKMDLQQQMQASENLAINPLMMQSEAKPPAASAGPNPDDVELEDLLRALQKENAELRAELKRYKIANQQHVPTELPDWLPDLFTERS